VQGQELEAIPLFSSLSRDERNALGRYLDRVDVRAGTELARQGALAYEFFLIKEGEASVVRDGENLATLGPGDFFGEIALMATDRRTATVTATTDMQLVVMHARDFRAMVAHAPSIAERLKRAIAERAPS
jgi:CRP/FNR family cyclic AMP-dependent transcriptional regulator